MQKNEIENIELDLLLESISRNLQTYFVTVNGLQFTVDRVL